MVTEQHPFAPFIPEGSTLLMLGSFPPQPKRWCMDFFYPNKTNDMWKLMGLIFYNDRNHFVGDDGSFIKEKIVAFCMAKGIALFDTATTVRRLQDNASDKFLEVVEATDVKALLQQMPQCRAIVTTGEKATDTLCIQLEVNKPKIGSYATYVHDGTTVRVYRMPSTSRAYPLALDKKADAYRQMFVDLGLMP